MGRLVGRERRQRLVAVRLSPQERQRVEKAAEVNRQRLSEFMRDALACAADDCLEPDLQMLNTSTH